MLDKLLLIGCFLTLLFTASCGGANETGGARSGGTGGGDSAIAKSAKTVFVLFDVSDSTKAEETRKKYLESFNRIADNLSDGDAIVADFISDNPLGQSSFGVNDQLPIFKTESDNEMVVKKQRREFDEKLKTQRKAIKEKCARMLAADKGAAKKTKILDSNQLAERVFKSYPNPRKILVVFSDMLESSEKGNFDKQKLTADLSAKTIDGERKNSRLPDLSSVKVYVVGAQTGGAANTFNDIENFWIVYYKACGADLAKENYGAALLRFDE